MIQLIRLASAGEHYAIVDDDIAPWINHLRWYLKKRSPPHGKVYVYRITTVYPQTQKYRTLHQEVALFHGLLWTTITHYNGNGLDNRLENLVPKFSVIELERRANAIREYQKIKAIRDYWSTHDDG